MRQQLPAAAAAVALVFAALGVLQWVSPHGTDEDRDSLRAVEPRTAAARAACAAIVIDQLVDSFNTGDAPGLVALLDDGAIPVGSFSIAGPGLEWEESDARRAADRLLSRHAAGERWTAERIDADAGPSWHGAIDVRIVLTRAAPDLPDGRVTATGTGVLSCVSGRIASLRLGPA
jgi:hypothetical protein